VVQPNGTGWDSLEYVGQVGHGQGGLHIGWDRMGLGQGGLQIRRDRLGQWTGLCPVEPVHLSQSGNTRPWIHFCTKKRCLWQGACREMSASHDVVSLREVNADGRERRGCTPAQQSLCSSNSLAFTSRFSAVAAELLISRHTPCHKHLSFVKFHSRRIPRVYRENHRNSCAKVGIPANSFSTRESEDSVYYKTTRERRSAGSQMGSPTVAEGGGEARGRGRGESGERSGVQAGRRWSRRRLK